ncbi:transporter, CPA2 family [Erysipelotrichaceae bacterium 3_1_53]|nr:transporter, CPA2 family [Erysipelotrichaceae bacterium 3_1_53]
MIAEILKHQGNAGIILSIAIILLAGFLCTRVTKRLRFPNVSGYIISGILIGPCVLHLIPREVIAGMDFMTDIALAFIAFGVGKYFRKDILLKQGGKIITITIFEALTAGACITIAMVVCFRLPWSFSLLLGSIGCATAPASTIMTIRQYHAKGNFVDTILQVTALDDAVALIAFSVCTALVEFMHADQALEWLVILLPVLWNIMAIVLAVVLAWVLHHIISEKRSSDHRLVLVIAVILALTGICSCFAISPLLSCMVLGAVYINLSGNKDLFRQVNGFTPPITLLFFVLSGMRLDLYALVSCGVIGIVYFFVRIIGKAAGAWTGARISHASTAVRQYLGLALIPQAGVSIGLAILAQRLLPSTEGTMLSLIILSSAVLYEMIGPACAKLSLKLSGSIAIENTKEKQLSIMPKYYRALSNPKTYHAYNCFLYSLFLS